MSNEETKSMLRLSMAPEEMLELFDILEKIDEHSHVIARIYNRIKLMHFKYTNGMAVSTYKVRAEKRVTKNSLKELGFTMDTLPPYDPSKLRPDIEVPAVNLPDPSSPDFGEAFMASMPKVEETKPFSLAEFRKQMAAEQEEIARLNKEQKGDESIPKETGNE